MVDQKEISLIKVAGARLREARLLTGLTMQQAAALLKISSGELVAYETGISVDAIPLRIVKAAADVFAVSVDFLLGINPDWEFSEDSRRDRGFLGVLERIQLEHQAEMIARQTEIQEQVNAISNAIAVLGPSIQAIDDSFMNFWMKNQSFADMPAGSTVLNRIDAANEAAGQAIRQLVRMKLLPLDALQDYPITEKKPFTPKQRRKVSN